MGAETTRVFSLTVQRPVRLSIGGREMPRLTALARALCGSAVADDLAQEAMLDAYRRWPEVSRYDIPEAWVRRVCALRASSLLRWETERAHLLAAYELALSGKRGVAVKPVADHIIAAE